MRSLTARRDGLCSRWAKLTILAIGLAIFPVNAAAQSEEQKLECSNMMDQSKTAAINKQWQEVVDTGQRLMSKCTGSGYPDIKSTYLMSIGLGLIKLERYEDAIPVLHHCVSLDPDFVSCWFQLGAASAGLGKIADARACFRKVIEIGAIDEFHAKAIRNTKIVLAELDRKYPEGSIPPKASSGAMEQVQHSYGTGFFVSNVGHILTNDHVVKDCKTLTSRDGKPLQLVGRDTRNDLALLKAEAVPPTVAVFRSGPPPKIGDSVIVFGFPLPEMLSSGGNVTTGVLSATSGLRDDLRFVQISAPVQPGNSGGPLLDSSGHIIGVVVAKLNALKVVRITGDVPQNVNFAVHWTAVRAFLDEQGIPYRKDGSQRPISTHDVAAVASQMSVALDCSE